LKKFNLKIFLLSTFVTGLLVIASFLSAFAEDEGTLGTNIISITLAKLFYVLRFPIHTLFWETFNNGSLFFAGLFLNCLFFGFLLEGCFQFYLKVKFAKKVFDQFTSEEN